jgi:hypothetical protein
MAERDPLASYRRKRDFGITSEPRGARAARSGGRYVIQKHAAKRLHYDLRLELDGTFKSVIRHLVFRGLRQGVDARRVTREDPVRLNSTTPKKSGFEIKVTHGERVIDPSTGLTKLALVDYYQTVAPLLLAQLRGRPTALVRAPAGVQGQVFFQKRAETLRSEGIEEIDSSGVSGHQPMLHFSSEAAIVYGSQMNAPSSSTPATRRCTTWSGRTGSFSTSIPERALRSSA